MSEKNSTFAIACDVSKLQASLEKCGLEVADMQKACSSAAMSLLTFSSVVVNLVALRRADEVAKIETRRVFDALRSRREHPKDPPVPAGPTCYVIRGRAAWLT